ncbi:MAG: hypothetical protein H6835_05890 [Planctomycetes bacterium]|nr:hypothetical protein [Planctomycetota bacterium]
MSPRFAKTIPVCLLSMVSCALHAQAPTLPPFRVLLQARAGAGAERFAADLARDLGEVVRTSGYHVVDEEQARLLASRERTLLQGFVAPDVEGDEQLALLSRCDVLIRLDVEPVRQKKQQGRYVSEYAGRFKISFVDSAEALGSGEGVGRGRTLDGYDEADRDARRQLVDTTQQGSLAAGLVAALARVREQERSDGARLTVALYVDDRSAGLLTPLAEAVAGADGVVADSFTPLRTYPSPAAGDKAGGSCSEFGVRYRGGTGGLQQAVLRGLREAGASIEKEHGVDLRTVVVASGRRLDVLVKASPSVTALADELEKVVGDAVDTIYRRYGGVLTGKRLAVLPASIAATSESGVRLSAFRRAFRAAYDAAELRLKDKPGADPLNDSGSVKVLEEAFENLGAAKQRLLVLEDEFAESRAGALAGNIGELVERAFDKCSAGAVTMQPQARDRDRAIDFIRIEAAASSEDGAVTPESVAFYEQLGSQFVVTTAVRRFLDQFQVTVNVTDLTSGTGMQGSARLHQRFAEQMESQLGS